MAISKKIIDAIYENPEKYARDISIEILVKLLKKLSDSYYNDDKELVSDYIFDKMKEILKERDSTNPFLYEIGAPVKGNKTKVNLPYHMGSLDKIKPETKDLDNWLKKYPGKYVISDKLDGVSAQLYKDIDGKIFLYSRGDGSIGQDISHLINLLFNKKTLDKIPKNTSIRGELVISKKNFEKIKNIMKNARNAVAGVVNSKTVDKNIVEITDFISYSILYPNFTQSEQFKLLDKWGLDIVEYKIISVLSDSILSDYLIKRRNDSEYEIDGIVCIDNSDAYITTKGNPEHAFAFKMMFDDQQAIVKVKKVIWEPSMDGYLKPVVEIEPVNLVGTTITFVTAHNAKMIEKNKIGKNSVIKIIRSGDVIPKIVEVIEESKKGDMPDCEYEWNETKTDLIIVNPDEKNKNIIRTKLIYHFFKTIGVKNLGEGIIKKFVDNGYTNIFKIINSDKKDLITINGLGEKNIDKIFNEIDNSLNSVNLETIMAASHLFGRGLGERKIVEILNIYPNILYNNWTKDEMIEKINEVNGFSDKLSEKFSDNFFNFLNFYKKLAQIYDFSRFKKINNDQIENKINENNEKIFSNKSIIFTGFRDKNLETFIISNGGKISTSVSKNTFMLIHKDGVDINSVKFTKAKTLGIIIISNSEFRTKYNIK